MKDMKNTRLLPLAWAGLCLLSAATGTAAGSATSGQYYGLTVRSGGVLELNGSPYRGIGLNFVGALQQLLVNPNDPSVPQDFQELEKAHIPFVRFPALGAWGSESHQYSYLSSVYLNNPTQYFNAMDKLTSIANQYHVGLIPSFFFTNWPDSAAEGLAGGSAAYAATHGISPCCGLGNSWNNPSSTVYQIWTQYTTQMVTRYEHNPAIWGWEFGNEFNLAMDLPNAAQQFPGYQPSWDYTHAQMWNAYQQFVQLVRQYDPYHIIEAGNSFPRPSSYHNMVDGTWTTDTPAQWAYMLQKDNAAFTMISGHAYGSTALEDINLATAVSAQLHKPLFVGEFAAPGAQAGSHALFQEILNTLVADKVPLASVWSFDDSGLTSGERSFMLKEIAAANAADGNPVPEPTTMGLFGVGGALGILLLKRRKAGDGTCR